MMTYRFRLLFVGPWLFLACAIAPLRVVVVFQETESLNVGDAVKVGKLHVGQVVGLKAVEREQVAVELQIDSTYRDRVTEDAQFSVERVSLLGGGHYVAIEPGVGPGVASGTQFLGDEALLTHLVSWTKELNTWLQNPELREKLKDFGRLVSDAASQGRESFEKARPKIEKQAAELLELAQREGPEVATRVKVLLDGLMEKRGN